MSTISKIILTISAIILIYTVSAYIHTEIILENNIKKEYTSCEIVRTREHGGESNILLNGIDIWHRYRDYTIHDTENDVTFTLSYKCNILFPFYEKRDLGALEKTREQKIEYKENRKNYEETLQNFIKSTDNFILDLNPYDSGSSFHYFICMYETDYNTLDKELTDINEYVCDIHHNDYSYIEVDALICNDLDTYKLAEMNKGNFGGIIWDESYLKSLFGKEATEIDGKAYNGSGFDKELFEKAYNTKVVFEYRTEPNAHNQPKQLSVHSIK